MIKSVKVGQWLEVKFKGRFYYGSETEWGGTWLHHFPIETAGAQIAQVLAEEPKVKCIGVKVVDRYELTDNKD